MADHDTDDAGQHPALRPSPLAPRDGGAAFTSVSQRPADRKAENLRWERLESLFRCLIQRHGRTRALAIMRDEDASSNADLAKWQAFGG